MTALGKSHNILNFLTPSFQVFYASLHVRMACQPLHTFGDHTPLYIFPFKQVITKCLNYSHLASKLCRISYTWGWLVNMPWNYLCQCMINSRAIIVLFIESCFILRHEYAYEGQSSSQSNLQNTLNLNVIFETLEPLTNPL